MSNLRASPTATVDFGRRVIRTRTRLWSLRLDLRTVVVLVICLALAAVLLLLALATGTYVIPLDDVLRTLTGNGKGGTTMVILEWRLPRALLAILFGAALGISGAIFQSLTRNPLCSPDIIGFASGSYTGALISMLLVGGGYYQVAAGSLVGGILTALLVYVLAYRRGNHGFRLIIVGIGVSAMLGAFNTWLMLKASLEDSIRAAIWGAGSLNALSNDQLIPVLCIVAILIPLAVTIEPPLRQLELGDDAARALGSNPNRVRLWVVDRLDEAGRAAVEESVAQMVGSVAEYVPGCRLKQSVQFQDEGTDVEALIPEERRTGSYTRVSVFLEVEGAAHYLPSYAGNLDIMTSAALRVAERLVTAREGATR
ncbi:iron chelate uptake ABC transporter family permease subunit [Paenarthrobacter sp. NPDC018779]|uniref:iron chelate uptake ABC transporter family permease subunit n=1 Tax=Paenarthrobacter sp. NPDC018779 TaxID=3364375 RepID=UPI0037CC838F